MKKLANLNILSNTVISLFLINYFVLSDKSLFSFVEISKADAPEAWQLGFQDPATRCMESMIDFHNLIMVVLIIIGFFGLWMLYKVFDSFDESKSSVSEKFTHSSVLEIVWTIIPAVILMLIAMPSFNLLYSLDEVIDPTMTLKIIGHQWYWSYEYSDYATLEGGESLNFDSYLIQGKKSEDDLYELMDNGSYKHNGAFRLLEVDNRVMLPVKENIRLLITAADVLHSWAVPSFGIKVDACPGRLAQASLFLKREGVYYGQCSEICGINHGFMPIVVKAVNTDVYRSWLEKKIENIVF